MGKPNVNRNDILNEKEVIETLRNCKRLDVQAFLSLLWITGARKGEILELRAKDLILNEDCLIINLITEKQRVKEWELIPRRKLKIPKNNLYYEIIKRYINNNNFYPEQKIFGFTFQFYWKEMKRANPNLYSHLFRHSRATILSDKVDIFDLKEWFGWKTIDMASRYVHRQKSIDRVLEALKEEVNKNTNNK